MRAWKLRLCQARSTESTWVPGTLPSTYGRSNLHWAPHVGWSLNRGCSHKACLRVIERDVHSIKNFCIFQNGSTWADNLVLIARHALLMNCQSMTLTVIHSPFLMMSYPIALLLRLFRTPLMQFSRPIGMSNWCIASPGLNDIFCTGRLGLIKLMCLLWRISA